MTDSENPRPTEDRGSSVPCYTTLLEELEKESCDDAATLKKNAKRWRQRGMWLSIFAAIGSGLAAAAVAVGDLEDDRIRAGIVVVAIIGAGLSGTAAAVGAPQQADKLQSESAQLRALARWSKLERARLTLHAQGSDQRVEAFYGWHDSINGVQTPESIRRQIDDEPSDATDLPNDSRN